jgi:putative SOS response-associated peptidase YedK
MQPIHRRMPVILDPHEYDRWLDINTSASELKAMTDSRPWHMMKASPATIAQNQV